MEFDTFIKIPGGLVSILGVLTFNRILDLRCTSSTVKLYIDEWLMYTKLPCWNFYGRSPSKFVHLCNKFNVPSSRWHVQIKYSISLKQLRKFCNLSSVSLIQVPITKALIDIIKTCKHIINISLDGFYIGEDRLVNKLSKVPTIQTLSLTKCSLINCDFSSYKSLTKLCISNNHTVTVTQWPENMTDLDISNCNLHELHTLPKSLRSLDISGNKLVKLTELVGLSLIVFKMSRVWVWGCSELLRAILKSMSNLKELDLSYTWTGPGPILDAISPSIEILDISNTEYLNSAEGAEGLSQLINLKKLDLCNSSITWGVHLLALQKMTRLSILSLRCLFTGNSTGNSLQLALMNKNKLEMIDLSACGFTLSYVLDSLCHCKKSLVNLNLSDNCFSDTNDSKTLINVLSELKLLKTFTCKESLLNYTTIEKILDNINVLVEKVNLTNNNLLDFLKDGHDIIPMLEQLLIKFQRFPNLKIGLVSDAQHTPKLYAHLSRILRR